MDLREYLFRKRISIVKFSKNLDCSRDHISRIIHGKLKPGKRLAADIERLTDGEVTTQELLGEK